MGSTASEKSLRNDEVPETDDDKKQAEEESNRPPDRLDLAIDAFFDEEDHKSFGEKFEDLRDALMLNSILTIKKIKKYGKKSPISEDEEYKHEECMKQFKHFEKLYLSQMKVSKAGGKTQEEFDAHWLKNIKNQKSSIGNIVTMIKK